MTPTATKQAAKPEIVVKSDYGRGTPRFLFEWPGYHREAFSLLKQQGATYEKPPGSFRGIIWCHPQQLRQCVNTLDEAGFMVDCDNLDLSKVQLDGPVPTPEPYEIIRVTDYSTVIHFEYNPKMVTAIKRIPVDDREFDNYTKDWKIKHTSLPTLIWGWKEIGLDVQRLEDIHKLVRT